MPRIARRLAPVLLLLLAAAAPPHTVARPAPATAPAAQQPVLVAAPHAEAPSLGERVNEFIDNLAAVSDRLLELPLYVQLIALAIPALLLGLLIARFARKRPHLVRGLIAAEAALLLLFLALLADRRIARLQEEVRDLRTRLNAAALTPSAPAQAAAPAAATGPALAAATPAPSPPPTPATKPAPAPLDLDKARETLTPLFAGVTLDAKPAGPALTFVQLKSETPLVKAFISIVDLSHPGAGVKINANLSLKTLTSAFARENKCIVAINGEAGSSPAMGAPLGPWTGHLVRDGEVLLTEQPGNPRPFLSFDKSGRARFISAAAPDRGLPPNAHNVLWGRWDVLLNSELVPADNTRQPRTGMALSKDRSKLFLFVGDGRQPRHSIGFTRPEVGNILRALGAADGMLCDEGGSSCMYLQSTNAIVNIPADRGGTERPVYTHFGITVK